MCKTYATSKYTHLQYVYGKINETLRTEACNILVQQLQHPDLLLQHPHEILATYLWNIWNTWNIRFQHAFFTLLPYDVAQSGKWAGGGQHHHGPYSRRAEREAGKGRRQALTALRVVVVAGGRRGRPGQTSNGRRLLTGSGWEEGVGRRHRRLPTSSSRAGSGKRGRRGALAGQGIGRRGQRRPLGSGGAAGDGMGWRRRGERDERMATCGEFFFLRACADGADAHGVSLSILSFVLSCKLFWFFRLLCKLT
jgi:hypothetical protein